MSKEIRITCKAADAIDRKEFKDFQGKLKDLKEEQFEQLKKSILQFGFCIPMFIWEHTKTKEKKIMDGHQRMHVLDHLVDKEGYTCPPLPVAWILADTEKEAAQILLELNTRVGTMTSQGLYEFSETKNLDFSWMKEALNLPEVNWENYENEYYDSKGSSEPEDETESETKRKGNVIECPECGHEFTLDK